MASTSRGPGESRLRSSLVRIVALVGALVAVVMLVWRGFEVGAAISGIAAYGLLAEEVCRRLGWLQSPRSPDQDL